MSSISTKESKTAAEMQRQTSMQLQTLATPFVAVP
jgi:hypothetical protein